MNRIFILFTFIFSSFSILLHSQTATEAYRLSISNPTGTARNLGVGNSMFAIGPDFSAIGSNPAGIGGFGRSEFLFTGSLLTSNQTSALTADRSDETKDNFGNFTFPNIGFVLFNRPQNSKWNSSNWAIGLNRMANYHREIQYAGNTIGSMTDSWKENAIGTVPADLNGFEEGLAYSSGGIYDFEEDNIYETDYSMSPQYALRKQEVVLSEGGKSELFLGYGADYDQKILFGFTVGMPFVNFTQNRIYEETDGSDDGVPYFNSLGYNSFVNTTGYGWNGKLGVTYRLTKKINVAIAVHTPTKLFLTDNYNTSVTYNYTDNAHDGPITSESPYGSFQYALRTPWSGMAGLGVVIRTSGFFGASVKLTNYSYMKYDYSVRGNGNSYDAIERQVNDDIKQNYAAALQLNLGGEYVLDQFRVRGGASFVQSPYSDDGGFDPSFHAGVGYRQESYYVDLGYAWTQQEDGYQPYVTREAAQPLVITDLSHHRISATVGVKF